MQPDQNPPPAPPPVVPEQHSDPSQYDFIFKPNQPQPKSAVPLLGGSSKKTRIIIVGVGVIVLIMLAMGISTLLAKAGKENVEKLVVAAQQQQELIRISEIGIDKARTPAAKNIALTTKLSLESQKTAMQSAIKSQGRKLQPKELAGARDSKTDEALKTAEQNNKFDEVFIETMEASLKKYQVAVKAAYDGASGKKLKDALTEQYQSANVLAGEASEAN